MCRILISECLANEVLGCSMPCEVHCQHYNGVICPKYQERICVFRCICQPGYLRIQPKECILRNSTECGGPYNYDLLQQQETQKPEIRKRKRTKDNEIFSWL